MGFVDFTLLDAIDIFIVALLMFQIYKLIKGTNALSIFIGILIVYFIWIVVRALNMGLLSLILGQIIGVGAIALIVLFQQEIRRFLLLIGERRRSNSSFLRKIFVNSSPSALSGTYISEIAMACKKMAKNNTGALIVVARNSDVTMFSYSGDIINADVKQRLLESIFFKNSPLHDGAVVIKDGRIKAARCILPTTDNTHLPAHYGMRHRAAIGASEVSDALIVVVSEETGKISIVDSGRVHYGIQGELLESKLSEYILKGDN